MIPWRNVECPYRNKAFNFLRGYYSSFNFNVIIGDSDYEHFNRSAARNAGVDKSTSDVVIVLDADNFIAVSQLDEAVRLAENNERLVKPFYRFGYLTEEATEYFYKSQPLVPHFQSHSFIDPPQQHFNGGCYVMDRNVWDRVGGFDPDFTGWGCEDDAFTLECERILGTNLYVGGYDYHLYHTAARVTSVDNFTVMMEKYVIPYKDSNNAV